MTKTKRFKTRAEYQKWYRETHPEYVKRCRELEKPKLKIYQAHTAENKKNKIIREYLREGMLRLDGWKIEITHLYNGKIESNRKLLTNDEVFSSHNKVLVYEFERMLREFGIKP